MHHRYTHATGRISATVSGPVLLDVTEGMIPAGIGQADDTHYVLSGSVIARPPAPAIPATKALAESGAWGMELPAGTIVYVNGRNEGAWNGSIQFDAPAIYSLRFVPPFPQMEAACVVTVA